MALADLKVGDTVTRMLGGTVPMEMVVVREDDEFLYCRPTKNPNFPDEWTFCKTNGVEYDEMLGWGKLINGTILTGSYLVVKE